MLAAPADVDAGRRRTGRLARSTVASTLGERLGDSKWADRCGFDASVVVTELVTNAVQAGCTQLAMTVQTHRSSIRLTVSDDAAGMPHVVAARSGDLHGRGLTLVAALAHAWGVDRNAHGKAVWADLALPPEAFAGESSSTDGGGRGIRTHDGCHQP